MEPFKDHFSQSAARYVAHRPTYPLELVNFLADRAPLENVAWDCGCGSGQLSTLLAERFAKVYATDASAKQIENAIPHPQVAYSCTPAEASGLESGVADLIVAAQAAHWFDLPAFYQEARRVGHSGSLLALVSYGIVKLDKQLDPIIDQFYFTVLGPYWPPERKYVEEGYRSFDFPFPELAAPEMQISVQWNLSDFLGYVNTWSSVAAMDRAAGREEHERFNRELSQAWNPPEAIRQVKWPLTVRAGVL
jgi:SAM-dependent methyltransferase